MEIRTVNPPKSVSGTTVNLGSKHPKLDGILAWTSFCLPFTAELSVRAAEIGQKLLKNAENRRKLVETWKFW